MIAAVGTHQRVTVYGVQGWRPGVDSRDQRFGATCEQCGIWRAPSMEDVVANLKAVPCRSPEKVTATLSADALSKLVRHVFY